MSFKNNCLLLGKIFFYILRSTDCYYKEYWSAMRIQFEMLIKISKELEACVGVGGWGCVCERKERVERMELGSSNLNFIGLTHVNLVGIFQSSLKTCCL